MKKNILICILFLSLIIMQDNNPIKIAEKFNDNKVTCLSVLTEEDFFLGSLDHISKIKSKC